MTNTGKEKKDMRGKITAIKRVSSCVKEPVWWAFFHMEDGKSARTCIVESFSNFQRWRPVIEQYHNRKEVILDGLDFVHGYKRLIDANSLFRKGN